jgi:hypothetical protein
MFYNYAGHSGGALLVALVAGDAALEFEDASDADGVAGRVSFRETTDFSPPTLFQRPKALD